jgi:RNA polymerase sigma factor (TIGR02999 family)
VDSPFRFTGAATSNSWHPRAYLAILIRMSDVTRILSQIQQGDRAAANQLLPIVYQELRRLAASKLARECAGQTLQATALVHEAYVRLVDQSSPQEFDGRGHFFAAAAEAMRRILVERARQKASAKRGGDLDRIDLSDVELASLPLACDDLLSLDEALQKLERLHPRKCQLTKLRFFAGLTIAEAAQALGVSVSTAEKEWAYARSWLRLEMEGNGAEAEKF